MRWVRANAVALVGTTLAAVSLALGAYAYRTAAQRDEQAGAVERRLERGEADLAERHRKGAEVLGELAEVVSDLALYAAAAAIAVGAWAAGRWHPSLWLTGATAALAGGAVGLALGSRA